MGAWCVRSAGVGVLQVEAGRVRVSCGRAESRASMFISPLNDSMVRRSRTRRFLRWAAVWWPIGAVVSFAVALAATRAVQWSPAARAILDTPKEYVQPETRGDLEGRMFICRSRVATERYWEGSHPSSDTMRGQTIKQMRSARYDRSLQTTCGPPFYRGLQSTELGVIECGWPLRSAWGWWEVPLYQTHVGPPSGGIHWFQRSWSGFHLDYPIPWYPLWSGLIVNAIVWGSAIGVVPVCIRLVRRRLRDRRGCCIKCGYSLAGLKSDACPECGTERAYGEIAQRSTAV